MALSTLVTPASPPCDPFSRLPLSCFLDVLSRLSPRERLLLSPVSRPWRAAVCSPCLYEHVDLLHAGDTGRISDALLAVTVKMAAGTLKQLSVPVKCVLLGILK